MNAEIVFSAAMWGGEQLVVRSIAFLTVDISSFYTSVPRSEGFRLLALS